MLHPLSLDVGIIIFSNVALSDFVCGDYIIFMLLLVKFDVTFNCWSVCCCRENLFS